MKAILWDMDGTLVDSEPLWGIATYELAEQMGTQLSSEVREKTVGGTTANTVTVVAEYAGVTLDAESHEKWMTWMYQRVATLLSQSLPFRPGVLALLHQAKEKNIPMALVTNTARSLTEISLDSIGRSHFSLTLCGDEVEKGKPAPDIYIAAAHKLGLQPQDCLALEDSVTGSTAAYNAGCQTVWIPTEKPEDPQESPASLLSELRPGVEDLSSLSISDLYDLWNELSEVTIDRVKENKTFDSLFAELLEKARTRPEGSGTVEALDKGVHFQGKKIVEEAAEVWLAAEYESDEELSGEISQLIYWLQVVMVGRGLTPEDIYKHL